MKVRVSFIVNITNDDREGIAWHQEPGQRRLATRKEIQDFFESYGRSGYVTINDELEAINESSP